MKLRTQLLLGYSLIFFFIIVMAVVTYQGINSLIATSSWVTKTQTVITQAHKTEKLLVDMQTTLRGFLLTDDEAFLDPFNKGENEFKTTLDNLKSLVSDNPSQLKLLEDYEAMADRWTNSIAKPEIEVRRRNEADLTLNKEIGSLVERKNEKAIMDTLRIASSKFISVEEGLLEGRVNDADASASRGVLLVLIVSMLAIVFGIVAIIFITRSILRKVGGEPSAIAGITEQIAQGNFDVGIEKWNGEETGILASVKSMLEALKTNRSEADRNNWLRIGRSDLNDQIRGVLTAEELSRNIITFLCEYIHAKVGIFYMNNGEGVFKLKASYAYQIRKNLSNEFKTGEGLIGQAALEKHAIVLTNVPADYIRISSGLGEKSPKNIIVVPIIFNDTVIGILELGSFEELNELQMTFLEEVSNGIAIALNSAQTRTQLADSLEKTQLQAHELKQQQEELQSANEELEEQTQMLLKSEEKLKAQQEELQVSNEELEETNESLKRQKSEIERTRREIEIKAEELAIASKYKSEFLANMSHELRTPLNSLLILSKLLADNKEGTLTEGQMESAEVIYKSGNDLLLLINEILDLAKIEDGRMDIHPAKILMKDLAENINNNFKPQFDEKGLSLTTKINKTAPEFITSDRQRAEQIIKNLMSNALKFTKNGGVTVEFTLPPKEINLSRSGLTPENSLAIVVKDTGIGIAPEKHKIIFEAFQQAEGGTTREYGGTGLGLSISRELAALLGGEIQLESEKGKGSVFTLYLPLNLESDKKTIRYARKDSEALSKELKESRTVGIKEKIPDDRNTIKQGDKTILIIEDDPNFAKPLLNQCREKGFKGIVAMNGEDGLLLADKFIPAAIILDLYLPGIDGWSVLDTLKNNPDTRHIPIHIMSVDDSTIEAFKKGAVGYLTKPVNKEELDNALDMLEKVSSKRVKDLLLVEDDKNLRNSIIKLIGNGDVKTTAVTNGAEAMEELKSNKYDCMILDLGLPDITGFELLKTLENRNIGIPPVIVYTGRDLTKEEEFELRNYAESIIIKGVKSEERLFDEASLFLHRMVEKLPEQKKKMIIDLHDSDSMFKGKKLLIVDDDMRNVFALSKLLGERGIHLLKAENGVKALDILNKEPDIDLVIMDIMMPEMDGYETIRRIRAQEDFYKLPIIALTAKAMKKDYEDCIAAGASDYLSKPIDISRLFSMLRVWLYR